MVDNVPSCSSFVSPLIYSIHGVILVSSRVRLYFKHIDHTLARYLLCNLFYLFYFHKASLSIFIYLSFFTYSSCLFLNSHRNKYKRNLYKCMTNILSCHFKSISSSPLYKFTLFMHTFYIRQSPWVGLSECMVRGKAEGTWNGGSTGGIRIQSKVSYS